MSESQTQMGDTQCIGTTFMYNSITADKFYRCIVNVMVFIKLKGYVIINNI